MSKLLLGLLLGLATSALAQDAATTEAPLPLEASLSGYSMAGVSPDWKASPIRVDSDGYVICSPETGGRSKLPSIQLFPPQDITPRVK